MSHSVTLTGLTAGTTYNYAVVSANSASGSSTSGNFTFATSSTAGPVISAAAVSGITTTSATIAWNTDQASSTQVKYGTTTAFGSSSALNSTLVMSHTVTLTGLTPGTLYDCEVLSTNATNITSVSTNCTFTTLSAGTTSSATYLGLDTTTQGTWTNHYGSNGYYIASDGNSLPAYATNSMTGDSAWLFATGVTDPRAPQLSSGSPSRLASVFYSNAASFSINLNLTDGQSHRIALYLLDWDTTTRAETITIMDAASQAVLDTRSFASFQNGQYAPWTISGNVVIQVTDTAGINAVVTGIFVD
jgi:hypothetical protein